MKKFFIKFNKNFLVKKIKKQVLKKVIYKIDI